MGTGPRFSPGDLVAHKRYGYRGVIAGCDSTCRASEDWYWSNASQPDRSQPWYHVLVHGGRHTTYVAQENLDPYEGGEQVVHPLTQELFESFSQGRYQVREGVTFPGPTG
ncbi:MAG: heat shock protein HspQ [Planctomycetota bacterium]|jgi:heat shock protein HspQ|nr:heat shock protein HspQ [Planctomycetota bacterium]